MSLSWQTVSVFVSSTFNDMHAERDYLVKRVFPELREWCEQRKLRLIDIDLRWGITEADATNRNVVKVCLNRIDECRPFFLCFLGQRRGWVPDKNEISKDTCDSFPDLKHYIGNSSVTEMEILHAIVNPLNDRKKAEDSFFYLRDPSYLNDLPNDPRLLTKTYTNEGTYELILTKSDVILDKRADVILKYLRKEEIKGTERPCRIYQARWDPNGRTPELSIPLRSPSSDPLKVNEWRKQWKEEGGIDISAYGQLWYHPSQYSSWLKESGSELAGNDLTVDSDLVKRATQFNELLCAGRLTDFSIGKMSLAEVIIADLKKAIMDRLPDHVEIPVETPLQKELDQQEQFLELNCSGFIEREGDFDAISRYIESGSQDLFVIAAPGGLGKTMFLANWIRRFQQISSIPIFFRFIGASDGSTTIDSILRSLLQEMKERELLTNEIPFDSMELKNKLPDLLMSIGSKSNVVIVIDALNQLATGLKDLYWLPRKLPTGVKIIVSFKRDGGDSETLAIQLQTELPDTFTSICPFDSVVDRKKIVTAYLDQYFKQLDDSLIQALIEIPDAINPLYLKVVLSEIRIYGSFEKLGEKIRNDFGKTPAEAFAGMLIRLENDPAYSPISMQRAVPLLFGFLSHARMGLSESELVDLFIQEISCNEETARDTIRLLVRQVRLFLSTRKERYDFFYESFKEAAIIRYEIEQEIGNKTEKQPLLSKRWHHILADYFYNLADPKKQKEWDKSPIRTLSELPYQIVRIRDYQTAESLLCDFTFIEASIVNGLFDQLLGDFDFITSKEITNIKTIHNSMLLSSAAIRHRPHLTLQILINRIRNEPIGSTVETQLKHAETCLDKRGIWLCSMTSFGSERLIKNIIGFLPHQNIIYVLTDQNMIESYDMGSYRHIARYGPFFKHDPIYIVIHPVSGRIIWMDSNGNIYDGCNPTKFRVRTRYFCFSFFGSGIIGVDTENNLSFYNFETESTKILAESMSSISVKIFTNLDCTSVVIISGDRIPSQRILIIQVRDHNLSITEWPILASPITSACINDDGSTVLFASRGGHIKIFNVSKRTVLQESSFRVVQGKTVRGVVQQCKMTSYLNKIFIAFATNEGELLIWDCKSDIIKKRGYYSSIKEPRNLRLFETLPGIGKFVIATDVQINILDFEDSGEFDIATPITNCSLSQDGWLILANNAIKSVSWFKNGQQRYNHIFQSFEPTSVAACSYNGTAFIGYNTGSVIRIQPNKELGKEDTVDLFDQPVVSVVNLDDERVLATSTKGELRIVRFQPVQVLRSLEPFGIAREEQYLLRLGPGDEFLCCGLNKIGSIQYTVYIVRHNDSREIVLETRDLIQGIAASYDGRAIFIAFNGKVCRFSKIHSTWIQDTCRSTDVLHIIACDHNLLGVIVKEEGISYLELWSMLGDNMETVIAMELPYRCNSICSNGNVIGIGAVDGRHCIVNIKNGERNEILSS